MGQGFAQTLADYADASNPTSGADWVQAAADRLPLAPWGDERRHAIPLNPDVVALNWRSNVADAAHELRRALVAREDGGTLGSPDNVALAALDLLRMLGEEPETGPNRWAVVNIPVTAVLGTFTTEAEAEQFNTGDPGAFVYHMSAEEAANVARIRAENEQKGGE